VSCIPGTDESYSLGIEAYDVFGRCRGKDVDSLGGYAPSVRKLDVRLPPVGELAQLSGRMNVGASTLAAQQTAVAFELPTSLEETVEIVGPADLGK
jgi:hypothetical protein